MSDCKCIDSSTICFVNKDPKHSIEKCANCGRLFFKIYRDENNEPLPEPERMNVGEIKYGVRYSQESLDNIMSLMNFLCYY